MVKTIQNTLLSLLSIVAIGMLLLPEKVKAQKQKFTPKDGLKVRTINVVDVTDDGRYAAALTSTRRNRLGVNHNRFADPTYIQERTAKMLIIDTETGEKDDLYGRDVQVRELTWSPDGNELAFFLRVDDEFELRVFNRESNRIKSVLANDRQIASNSLLKWRPDGSGLLLELRPNNWEQEADSMYKNMTEGPVIVQDSENDFLAWDRIWKFSERSILTEVDVENGEVSELTSPGIVDGVTQQQNGDVITFNRSFPVKTDYKRRGDSEYALMKLSMAENVTTDTLISRTEDELNLKWNHAGDRYAFSEEGKVYLSTVEGEDSVEVTEGFYEQVEDEDTTSVEYSVERWQPEDSQLLLESDLGYHIADPEGGKVELVYEFPENRDEYPERDLVSWSPDGRYLYMTYSARDHWERGLTRYDLVNRSMEELLVDNDLYTDWEFSENGEAIFYESSNGNLPKNLYVAGPKLENPRKLTNLNPWINNKKVSQTELIQYMDVDGDTLHGVLYYPTNYEEGKQYPLVANVYEDYFDNGFNTKMNILANEGYFVFRPSVDFDTGYPGEAWLKGVTTGINKLMERGLVDGTKLGVQGVSYGGYAVNLLITQTDRFAAAINVSGKVNMISFLGDSPKITTRNYDAAEVGQDRIGETLWEATDKYIDHSAVFFADRIDTPLLMLTGEGDWNVPATNQREMYYAMRRLDKEVKWVHYMHGGHGAGRAGRVEDYLHHWDTILNWYDAKFYPSEDKE